MIKFFRTIRKDHMEKNKIDKYFKYAVGEIALVMIAILLSNSKNINGFLPSWEGIKEWVKP